MDRMRVAAAIALVITAFAVSFGSAGASATDQFVAISTNCSGGQSFCFTPANVTITEGTTVTWSDQSGVEHFISRCDPSTCSGVTAGTGVDYGFADGYSGYVGPGPDAPYSHTFNGLGTYNYYCAIHGYAAMHGSITVVAATPSTTVPSTITSVPSGPSTGVSSTTAVSSTTLSTTVSTTGSGPASSVAASAASDPTTPQLANTGSGARVPFVVAAALIALGLAAMSGARFRRRPGERPS